MLGYLAGIFVDHQDLKKVLTFTNLLRALIVLALLLVGKVLILTYLIIIALATVTLFFLPAEGSALPSLVKEKKDLLAANSLFTITIQASVIVGFVAAGPMLALLGEKTTLVILAACFIAAFGFVWSLPDAIRSLEEREKVKPLKSFIDGISFFFRTRSVRDAIFFLTSAQAIILVLATIAPGFVDKILNLDVKLTSIILVAPAAFGMILGSLALGQVGHRYKEKDLVNAGLVLAAGGFLALSFLERTHLNTYLYFLAVICIILLGVATSLITVPATTELQADTPERMRGRTYGILGTFGSGASAIPVILAGTAGDVLGVRTVILTLGVLSLLAALYRLGGRRYT